MIAPPSRFSDLPHALCNIIHFLPSKKCFSATRVVHNKTIDSSQNNVKYIFFSNQFYNELNLNNLSFSFPNFSATAVHLIDSSIE